MKWNKRFSHLRIFPNIYKYSLSPPALLLAIAANIPTNERPGMAHVTGSSQWAAVLVPVAAPRLLSSLSARCGETSPDRSTILTQTMRVTPL